MTNIKTYLENGQAEGKFTIEDIANYGIDYVAPNGLITYGERRDFYNEHFDEILETVEEIAEANGGELDDDPTMGKIETYEILESVFFNQWNEIRFYDMESREDFAWDKAREQVESDYKTEIENGEMDEDELSDLTIDYMADVEMFEDFDDMATVVALVVRLKACEMVQG